MTDSGGQNHFSTALFDSYRPPLPPCVARVVNGSPV